MVTTGQVAVRTTFSVLLPTITSSSPEAPLEPITIRSGLCSAIDSVIPLNTEPSTSLVFKVTAESLNFSSISLSCFFATLD